MRETIVLGTRGSALALWQAKHVQGLLTQALGATIELQIIKTSGDKNTEQPLSQIGALAGGKGLFVKEIEEALLAKKIDFAVHSSKDLPSVLAPGLSIAAFMHREDPRDALLVREGVKGSGESALPLLPKGAGVGTSSLRRMAQLRRARPDLRVTDLRGNVDTRVRKLDEGKYDAIVLALAGLKRMGLGARATSVLTVEEMLPAVGQGALGIEVRAGSGIEERIRAVLDHAPTRASLEAERGFLARLGGGCTVPVGAHATVSANIVTLEALISGVPLADPAAAPPRVVRGTRKGETSAAAAIGAALAEELLSKGGAELLGA